MKGILVLCTIYVHFILSRLFFFLQNVGVVMGSPVGPVLVNYIILVLNNYDANSQMASGTVIYIMSVLKTE